MGWGALRRFLYLYLFCTAFAAVGYACVLIFAFFTRRIPYEFMSSSRAWQDAFNIVIGILITGVFFMLAGALQGVFENASISLTESIPDDLRYLLRKFGAIFFLAIGGSGVVAAAVAIVQEVNLHAMLGIWQTMSVCEEARPASHIHCPVETPIVSWIMNTPLFIVYGLIGLFCLHKGVGMYREEPE